MAFGTITSTSNTFGSVDGTATGVVPGTLSGSVGVPGPQGPAGTAGPQGPAGTAGVGVPAGGTAGQFLTKIDGTNYNTDWTTLDVSDKRDLTDYDFTNVADTKLTTFGLTLEPNAGDIGIFDSNLSITGLNVGVDESDGGTLDGVQSSGSFGSTAVSIRARTWTSGTADAGNQATLSTTGLSFRNYVSSTSGFTQYGNTSITFPNASVQTIAFPGFNNAALTGNPTAPTAALGDNDTSIATTAFVQQELLSGTANARNLEVYVRNQTGSTIPAGSIVYINGATGNRPTITLAQANNDANSAQTIGFTKTAIANNGFGFVIVRGELENINTSALTEGVQLYLSPTTAGTWTTTKPSAPQHLVYVGIVIRAHPTLGTILVSVQNGYELSELHDVALASEANNDLLVYELSTDLWKNKSFSTLGLAGLNSPTFTGTPSLPTGTTAVTQTAGDNTTALATTAFVTAAVPAFATIYQARDGTSTTLAVNPAGIGQSLMDSCYRGGNFSQNAVSGTGATVTFFNLQTQRFVGPNASLAGYSLGRTNDNNNAYLNYCLARGLANNTVSFAKPYIFSFRLNANTLAGNTIRFKTGQSSTNTGGDPTVDGFGIRIVGTGAVELQCFKTGPGLTNITSSFTPTSGISFDVIISSNNGTVLLYINDTLVATNTDGPTSANTFNANSQIEVIGSGTQASNTTALVSNLKIFNGP